ncbi:4Fe-4S binding protein [Oscillochloris sp. ZM17-4]|uniref:4Fe-4S binding protein n=1 Tax=Oscillochloris sp. ZM17-4 TaxID=2866714 RepID=UPI001C738B96|nr:4Fe-4S binding protein [Oscillochloris sp. ZM17-4]MBX0327321.1 4Fe-4S binding protein [Oscillochloris sp. ZM17-4]
MSTKPAAARNRNRLAALWGTQSLRRITQFGFLAMIVAGVVRHTLSEDSTSPEAVCPFGGLETLYSYFTTGGTISHTHLSNLVLLGAVVLLTLLARGAFCGWICPFGTIQEWVNSLSRWLQARIKPLGRAARALRRAARRPIFGTIDRVLSYGRYVVLATIIGGTVAYGSMVFRDYDPWSALISVAEFELTAGAVILGVVLLASLVVERPWCRYACPLGATIGLVGRLSPMRIQREDSACTGCTLCTHRCPMGIDVAASSEITDMRCISCLQCVDSCVHPEALDLRLSIPLTTK